LEPVALLDAGAGAEFASLALLGAGAGAELASLALLGGWRCCRAVISVTEGGVGSYPVSK